MFIVLHELCECKCVLNESVCNSKQKRNHEEYWCGCKELNDWLFRKNDYMTVNVIKHGKWINA